MRVNGYALGIALALGVGMLSGIACSAGAARSTGAGVTGSGGASSGPSGPSGSGGVNGTSSGQGPSGNGGGALLDASFDGNLASCASFHAAATQDPAAMLIVLQGSASMSTDGKWTAAQQAIVQAIDQDVFDTMSIGLTAFPTGTTPPPACLEGIYPSVYCSYPTGSVSSPLPVPIAAAGTNKSTAATGVRHDILTWLNSNTPESQDPSNSSPVYDAMNAGYQVLQGTNIAKRMLILITDGGFDCTSVSNPTRPGISDGLCNDWEYPTTVNTLITNMRTSTTAPIDTFIVGVPGSNTSPNEQQGLWTAAPYWMLLALSTYAVSGSPTTVDPNCDKTAVWTMNGAPPANPCHIDLSGSNFNASALADAIATIRGKELGCTYNLPAAPMGMTIDKSEVNVVETINGTQYLIPQQTNPNDMCTGNSPCWNYNANGQVVLIGSACSAVQASATATVDIYVGCDTVTQ